MKAIYDRAYKTAGLMGTHYDTEYSRYTKEALLAHRAQAPFGDILDLGTGDGDLWEYAPKDTEWHGIDISETGVRRAKTRFPSLSAVVGVAEHLPYASESFSLVVAADTLEHTVDLQGALAEIHRILIPGGVLAFSVPTPNSLRKWVFNFITAERPSPRMILGLVGVVLKRIILFGRPDFQPIDRDLELSRWEALVGDAGFEISRLETWPTPPKRAIIKSCG